MEAEESDSTCQNFARAASSNATPFSFGDSTHQNLNRVTASNASPFSLNSLWMDYTLYNDRLKSFRYWNFNHVISGEHLARSGFYYQAESATQASIIQDTVHCGFCSLKLRSFTPTDNGVAEHYRFSKNCKWIKMLCPT